MTDTNRPKPLPINGDVYWAELTTTNKFSGKYQFCLCNLSDAAVEALEMNGMQVRTDDKKPEQGRFITMRSKNPIRAYNTSGDQLNDSIGNGSTATVRVGHYDWNRPAGGKGRSPSCQKLTIRDLVVYEGSAAADDNSDLEAAL